MQDSNGGQNPRPSHPDGWRIGDRVEVSSLWVVRRVRNHKGRRATGHIEEFTDWGSAIVRFDCGLVNGVDTCSASPSELTRIEDFRGTTIGGSMSSAVDA